MVVAVSLSARAHAQAAPGSERDAGAAQEEQVARDSPRASVADFFALCRAGNYREAMQYLELSRATSARGEELARRLMEVLKRTAWIEPDSLSPLSTGKLDDDLPRSLEQVAVVEGKGDDVPVQLVRRSRNGGRWLFSADTVTHIDGWYEELEGRWLLERLPRSLLATGPHELMWWQWLALPFVAAFAWLIGRSLSHLTVKVLARVASRTKTSWDDAVLGRLKGPLTLWAATFAVYLVLPWLTLYEPAQEFVKGLLRGSFLLGLFWALSRLVDVAAHMAARTPAARAQRASSSLIPLGVRVAKVVLLAIAVVSLLSQLGYPVASLLAGLGLGGLALALAAQKTVENLFGAFSIGADQPFREGDFVRVDDFMGTVERIGLRSTQFRTLDRTIISIPNGKLADMKLETFAPRDRLRFVCNLGLVYGTTQAQMRQVLSGIERRLQSEPKLSQEGLTVAFTGLGTSSLDIEVAAYFNTADWAEFTRIREQLLLDVLALIEDAGAALAFPTQSVQVVQPALREPERPKEAPTGARSSSAT